MYSRTTCETGSGVRFLVARFCPQTTTASFGEMCKPIDFSILERISLVFSCGTKYEEVEYIFKTLPAMPKLNHFQFNIEGKEFTDPEKLNKIFSFT